MIVLKIKKLNVKTVLLPQWKMKNDRYIHLCQLHNYFTTGAVLVIVVKYTKFF